MTDAHSAVPPVSPSGRLAGKVALITGAAMGLGLAMSRLFQREGAQVVMTDIATETGAAAAAGIPGALFLPHDVTDEARWVAVLAEVAERFGALHVLVNNAGIGVRGTVEQTSLADWRRCMAVNAEGPFLGCKHAIPYLRKAGGGSIINLSSVAGLTAAPPLVAYSASKGAVRLMSKSIAVDLAQRGDKIRCNSIHPVFTDTPMVANMVASARNPDQAVASLIRGIPLGRLGRAEEVAAMALYLASDDSAFVTGAEFVIDGGFTAA